MGVYPLLTHGMNVMLSFKGEWHGTYIWVITSEVLMKSKKMSKFDQFLNHEKGGCGGGSRTDKHSGVVRVFKSSAYGVELELEYSILHY